MYPRHFAPNATRTPRIRPPSRGIRAAMDITDTPLGLTRDTLWKPKVP